MYDCLAIVRKVDDGMAPPVNELANVIHEYGKVRNLPVFDHHLGTNLPRKPGNVLFVSLGGDGTLLYAAHRSMEYGSESGIVGFNLGRLGFLTEEIDKTLNNESFQRVPNDVLKESITHDAIFAFLDAIVNNDKAKVKPDTRMMLQAVVWVGGMRVDGDTPSDVHYAMNEITLYTSLRNFMDTKVAINSQLVGTYGGNGAAVTTSTGSTALGLSAGGSIINPSATVMQIVPLLPHKVAKQPIITSGRDEIILRSNTTPRTKKMYVLADSRQVAELDYGNGEEFVDVAISRAKKDVTLWRPTDWNFFDVLSQKMGWH